MLEKSATSKEFKYHIHIGEQEKEALLQLNMLRAAGRKTQIRYTNLVAAFFMLSIAIYSFSLHISFAWIFMVLSICLTIMGISVGKFQKSLYTAVLNKEYSTDNNNERSYIFSREGVDISSELGISHNFWNAYLYRGEIEHYIYLMRKDRQVVLIDKNELAMDQLLFLQELIQEIEMEQYEKSGKTPLVRKVLIGLTVIVAILAFLYIGTLTLYPLRQGEIFHLWFARTTPMILLLIFLCLDIVWTYILSKIVKEHSHKSLGKRIMVWVVGIMMTLVMGLGVIMHMLNDASEHENGDGTVIIEQPIWLGATEFKLYQEENFLTLRFLRDADGIEDIDSSISQDEYLDKKLNQQNKEEESETYEPIQNTQEDERTIRIDEGYQKIYDTFLEADGNQYVKAYSSKGDSYITVYEDETQIRYLMYDRDDSEGKSAQYVYFFNEKNADGSWSPAEAEILSMYQYDYESKEAVDLEKTTW